MYHYLNRRFYDELFVFLVWNWIISASGRFRQQCLKRRRIIIPRHNLIHANLCSVFSLPQSTLPSTLRRRTLGFCFLMIRRRSRRVWRKPICRTALSVMIAGRASWAGRATPEAAATGRWIWQTTDTGESESPQRPLRSKDASTWSLRRVTGPYGEAHENSTPAQTLRRRLLSRWCPRRWEYTSTTRRVRFLFTTWRTNLTSTPSRGIFVASSTPFSPRWTGGLSWRYPVLKATTLNEYFHQTLHWTLYWPEPNSE